MSDVSGVYESTRKDLCDLLRGLSDEDLDREVPATPGWTVRNIATHLTADASCVIASDFPREFFQSFGDEDAVVVLNKWTAGQLSDRAGMSLEEIFDEWDASAEIVTAMMRKEKDWPDGLPWFTDRVLITDLAVHQQDIYGALGIQKDREAPPVKIGLAGYIGTMDFRLKSADEPALRFESGEKVWTAGGDEPKTTVRASRFELFRAMSGRRNPDQIRAYDWDGDPEPFISYFYPYGVRSDALVE